jgi:hypothetical protein
MGNSVTSTAAVRCKVDQADGLLLAFFIEAEGQRRAGIANMIEPYRLRAVQVPQRNIVRPVECGRRYRFNPADHPHERALAFARGGTIYECMGNHDPAHSVGNVFARAGELGTNDIGRTSNFLVFEAQPRRIFESER